MQPIEDIITEVLSLMRDPKESLENGPLVYLIKPSVTPGTTVTVRYDMRDMSNTVDYIKSVIDDSKNIIAIAMAFEFEEVYIKELNYHPEVDKSTMYLMIDVQYKDTKDATDFNELHAFTRNKNSPLNRVEWVETQKIPKYKRFKWFSPADYKQIHHDLDIIGV